MWQGVDHEMTKTLGGRLLLDVAFYIIVIAFSLFLLEAFYHCMDSKVLAILRQIFFAIIVDTFSKLREEKFERYALLVL